MIQIEQSVLLCDDDFVKVEEYLPVITYIAGYVCFSINKRLKCICCKRRMICDTADVQYIEASFTEGISRGGLVLPSPEMVRIALVRYSVIIKLCESNEFRKCSSQRDCAVKLLLSFLEAEDFPFFLMDNCENCHDPRTIVKMACWICSNILLNNYCFKRNDLLTNDKLSKKRKLQTLT